MFSRFIDDPSAGPSSTVAMTSGELEPSSLKSNTSKSLCGKYVPSLGNIMFDFIIYKYHVIIFVYNRTSAHNFLHAKKTSGRKYTVSIVLICIWLFCTVSYLFYSEVKSVLTVGTNLKHSSWLLICRKSPLESMFLLFIV